MQSNKVRHCLIAVLLLFLFVDLTHARPIVMLTGYWHPTSEMLCRFSIDPELNPEGWIGENWEDRGYDVYAFFPAFDVQTREFEVDYQATWQDFWARVEEFHPEIIISYGSAAGPWEIEDKALNSSSWTADDISPFFPTPNPPDSTIAADEYRYSTLPMESIEEAVNQQTNIHAWIDVNGDPGIFLCNYIAYLGMWYQSIHSAEDDEYPCRAAGFIHVNPDIPVADAAEAAEVTLRTTLESFESRADLAGNVWPYSPLSPCQITLRDPNQQIYQIIADEDGHFLFENMLFREYLVTAVSGRYSFYHGVFNFASSDDFLEIEMEEYSTFVPLTYCAEASELIQLDHIGYTYTAAYFPPEILEPFSESHLNSLLFKAPENSNACAMMLSVYQGNPLEGPYNLIQSCNLPSFQQGDYVEAYLPEIHLLTDEDLQLGLTISLAINSAANYIAYSDNESANPNGNLIKAGENWLHGDTDFGIQGNWALQLGFYETPSSGVSETGATVGDFSLVNYPNPFNPSTTISFSVQDALTPEIHIYDITGKLLRVLKADHPGFLNKGSVTWNGRDQNNQSVASGVYFYRLHGIDGPVQKMILLK